MKLSDLTIGYAMLTDKQYALLRDAGVPKDELIGKPQSFYATMKDAIAYKGADGPALQLQLNYLAAHDVELDRPDLTYGVCRHAIRTLAKMEASDQRYLKFIAAYEADNAKRNDRRKRTETEPDSEAQPDTSEFLDLLNDMDWPTIKTDA